MLSLAIATGSEVQLPGEHGNGPWHLFVPSLRLELLSDASVHLRQDIQHVLFFCQLKHRVCESFDEPGTVFRVAPRNVARECGVSYDVISFSGQG